MADEEGIKVPTDPAKVVAARRAMFRQMADTRLRVDTTLERLFLATDFRDDAAVNRLLRRVTSVVEASQLSVAQYQLAYQRLLASALDYEIADEAIDRKRVLATRTTKSGATLSRLDVYRRPVTQIYTALSQGKSFPEAQKLGVQRLQQLVSYDLQASSNLAASVTPTHDLGRDGRPKVIRYRRTLTGSENCAICELAATQRYWTGDLRPIHGSCDCGVEPLPPGFPRGQVIDPVRLAEKNAALQEFIVTEGNEIKLPDGSTRQPTFKDLRFVEDSEKGFVVDWANRSHKKL